MTIVRQHVIDTYEVVQNMPCTYPARVMAVNPINGDICLVSDAGNVELAVQVVGFPQDFECHLIGEARLNHLRRRTKSRLERLAAFLRREL